MDFNKKAEEIMQDHIKAILTGHRELTEWEKFTAKQIEAACLEAYNKGIKGKVNG